MELALVVVYNWWKRQKPETGAIHVYNQTLSNTDISLLIISIMSSIYAIHLSWKSNYSILRTILAAIFSVSYIITNTVNKYTRNHDK